MIAGIGIALLACTMGLVLIALVMLVMGLAGAPGAIVYEAGERSQNDLLRVIGFLLAALGQSYIVGAYVFIVVGALRTLSEARPDVSTWPLWFAAFFHSFAVPAYAMEERPDVPTAQHHSLGVVALASLALFVLAVVAPGWLSHIYFWLPLFKKVA
ncbi:MAG: hypothetical protein NTZ09_04525 [Candidatus Hydrogenedentes bacterium]|nr:hypothetical protein [Candidatus Hydrogenedentota bacterium]